MNNNEPFNFIETGWEEEKKRIEENNSKIPKRETQTARSTRETNSTRDSAKSYYSCDKIEWTRKRDRVKNRNK